MKKFNAGLTALVMTAGVAVVGLTPAALADGNGGISDVIFTISAQSEEGSGTWSFNFGDGTFGEDGSYRWILSDSWDGEFPLTNEQGVQLGTLTMANVFVNPDPVVNLNFAVQSLAFNTAFTVTSPLLSFAAINNAQGRASASIAVTDVNGNGATATPSGPGGDAYLSRYNGMAPGGTTFADLLGAPIVAPAFGSNSDSADFPGGGAYTNIAGAVADMSSRFAFSLTAFDLASGTSSYEIIPIPAPGAAALLGLGGLAFFRRRR